MIISLRKSAILLLKRLERLSADSNWAHRASGVRGAIIREIENLNDNENNKDLEDLIELGFNILTSAAREIPETRE